MASNALVVKFAADVAPAQREIARFAASTAASMAATSGAVIAAARASSGGLDDMAKSGALAAARFGASAVAIQVAARATAAAVVTAYAAGAIEIERFAAIAEKARSADLGTSFFQSFTRGADVFRIKIRDAEADLARLAANVRDRFDGDRPSGAANQGRDALRASFLGTADFGRSAATDLFDQAKNSEERARAVLVALRDMEAAGQRLAAIDLAERMGLTKLAAEVDRGRTSFGAFLGEVDRLAASGLADGSIIAPELISRAEELKRRFGDASDELGRNMRPLLDECARLALAIGNGAAWAYERFVDLVGVVGRVVAALRNGVVEANALSGAAARLQAIQTTPGANDAQAAREAAAIRMQRGTRGQAIRAQGEVDSEFSREAARGRGLGDQPGQTAPTDFSSPVPNLRPVGAPGPSVPSAGRRGGSGRAEVDEWAKAYERLVDSMDKANAQLKAEVATVGQGSVARERAVAIAKAEADARRTGGVLTDEQRSKVAALADEHARLKNTLEDSTAAQRAFGDAMQYAGDRLVDMAFQGRSASDVLRGLAAELARAALTGQGVFGRLLGLAPAAGSPAGSVGGLFGLFSGGGGAAGGGGFNGLLGGALIPGILHSGGVVGRDGYGHGRLAPVGAFVGAPRHHAGLAPDERPSILQVGEEVLSRAGRAKAQRQMEALGRMNAASNGASAPSVTQYNDFRGVSGPDRAWVEAAIAKSQRETVAAIRPEVRDAQRRGASGFR